MPMPMREVTNALLARTLAACLLALGSAASSGDATADAIAEAPAVATDGNPVTRGVSRIGAPVPEDPGARARAVVASALTEGHSAALVIGISAFDSPGWNDLPGVEDEIPEVARALAVHGFEVEYVAPDIESGELRLDRDALRSRIRTFLDTRGGDPEARLLIYVATHGFADPAEGRNGQGHLVASDSLAPDEPGFVDSTYTVQDLARDLGTIRARHVMLLFNSCFSGAMVPSVAVPGTRGADTMQSIGRLSATTTDWAAQLLGRDARLVLTAGSAGQEVPDADNPFARAVTGGLYGDADLDGDGVILGTELAMHVRASVARETRELGAANDPVFALLPRCRPGDPCDKVADLELGVDGDFLFLSPRGASPAEQGDAEARLAAMNARLRTTEFVDCVDCPRMVRLPTAPGMPSIALSRTEITQGQWQACYRELGCRRFVPMRQRVRRAVRRGAQFERANERRERRLAVDGQVAGQFVGGVRHSEGNVGRRGLSGATLRCSNQQTRRTCSKSGTQLIVEDS